MGGSGGFWSGGSGKSIEELIFDAQSESMKNAAIADINNYILDLLKEFNDRDIDMINQHLDTIQKALEKDIEGSLKLLFGGSISKHTYINGLSDVDILVTVNNSSLVNKSPKEVLNYFYERLSERLPNTNIKVGKLAVTLEFTSGNEIQLLPTLRTKTGIKISEIESNEWSSVVKPIKFAKEITNVNKNNNNKVVPVIKLFKSINSGLSDKYQLSGYHIESLAVKAFQNYQGKTDYFSMLRYMCNYTSKQVVNPVKDITGQSFYIDKYLGAKNSHIRNRISKKYERILNKINNSVNSGSDKIIKEMI